MPASTFPLRYFEPQDDFLVVERKLPHWSQSGTLCFITFRTFDSMPKSVLDGWFAERREWLQRHGIDPQTPDWKGRLAALGPQLEGEFQRTFSERWHMHLDACHGACILKRPELSKIVADSLRHFDEDRYLLTDFVVMPNHVHVLAAFVDEDAMLAQCDSWKHYTARQINQRFGRKGRFWQIDGFDHLVRSEEQFARLRRYIAENPGKARLKLGEYLHYARSM
jgi:type I restriction enzyme R subunit